MHCDELAANLTEFMEGGLAEAVEEEAISHLASCEHCEQVLAETRTTIALARAHLRESVDGVDRDRMFASIAETLEGDASS